MTKIALPKNGDIILGLVKKKTNLLIRCYIVTSEIFNMMNLYMVIALDLSRINNTSSSDFFKDFYNWFISKPIVYENKLVF